MRQTLARGARSESSPSESAKSAQPPVRSGEAEKDGKSLESAEKFGHDFARLPPPGDSNAPIQRQGFEDLPEELQLRILHQAVGSTGNTAGDIRPTADTQTHRSLLGTSTQIRRIALGSDPQQTQDLLHAQERSDLARRQNRLGGLQGALTAHPLNDPLRARNGGDFDPGNAFRRQQTRAKRRKARIVNL